MTQAQAIYMALLVMMAIGLMSLGYYFRKMAFVFGAAGGWMLLAAFTYSLSVAAWDIFYGTFWFCIGLVIITTMEGMALRQRDDKQPPDNPDTIDRQIEKAEKFREKQEKYAEALEGSEARARRKRRKKLSEIDTRLE